MSHDTRMRIDAHQHYWQLSRADYGWLTPAQGSLYRDFLPAELAPQLAAGAVSATVLVQAAATEAETRYLIGLAQTTPSITGVVGWADFEAGDIAERICGLVRDGGGRLKGLRPMVQDIADPEWLLRPAIDAAFSALVEQQLRLDALVTPAHLDVLMKRLRRHPALQVVLDHCGKPDIAAGAFEPWASQVAELAQTTPAFCKLSGLLSQAAPGAGVDDLAPFVGHVFHCFGAGRILWGSDWPVVTAQASYQRWLQMSLELVHRFAPGSERAVFATNAVRFYGLDIGHC
ncbi:MAG: amidohydrolase family protein [Steroidobacteraceae bacterium]